MGHHDAFEWIASIWIPLALGAATVTVAVSALIASSRATRIAHEVENQREKAAADRAVSDRAEKLRLMSIDEARTLSRYARQKVAERPWLHLPPQKPEGEALLRAQEVKLDAETTLEQSLVPGASDLLALTEFDLKYRFDHMPDLESVKDDAPELTRRQALRSELFGARTRRIHNRIRDWALDPEASAPKLAAELKRAYEQPVEYLTVTWKD